MAAQKTDLLFEQGADFYRLITFTDENGDRIDLTGWIFEMQIRPTYSSSTILLNVTCGLQDQTAPETKGQMTISATADETEELPVVEAVDYDLQPTRYAYTLIVTKNTGEVLRLMEGAAIVSPEVTR